jgi:hypothetical protein
MGMVGGLADSAVPLASAADSVKTSAEKRPADKEVKRNLRFRKVRYRKNRGDQRGRSNPWRNKMSVNEQVEQNTQENKAQQPSYVHKSSEGIAYIPAVRAVEPAQQTSPRLVYGPKGDKGDTGVGIPGPQGEPGKDADIAEVVAESKKIVSEAVAKIQDDLRSAIVSELTSRGVIDANGNAIPGPAGQDGADSTVPGPAGKDGESIVGPAGRDGVDGQSITGPAGRDGKDADITEVVETATTAVDAKLASFKADLRALIISILKDADVLDANGNAIPGPAGAPGVPGPRGPAGNIEAAVNAVNERLREAGVTN